MLRQAGFPDAAIDTAEAIAVAELLQEWVALAARPIATAAQELRMLRVRQSINDRILLAMLDISSLLAELDCEGERGDGLRFRLVAAQERRNRRLEITGIITGALTAALTGGLSLAGGNAGNIVGILGGTTEAGIGTALLYGNALSQLRTERNLLREVWEAPATPSLFPRSVWRYLHLRPAEDPERPSVAERLRAAWQANERLGPPGSAEERRRIALLFGEGGDYSVDDLELRDTLLDLLEASVALISRDLRSLLEALMTRPAPMPRLRPAA